MESNLHTLSKIFTERLFRIPDYQRGYAWTGTQLLDFWNDLEQLEPGRSHYTGVLTLENVPQAEAQRWDNDLWIISAKNYEPYFVVDGQQRLTTSIVLIQAILDKLPEGGKLNFTDKADIRKKFIVDSKDGLISRSYIFGYQHNNPGYNHLRLKIFGEIVPDGAEETVYTQNLENAKRFFDDKLSGMDLEAIEVLYRKVTQGLLFNVFTISNEVDVCVAFETMNNRGKPLSYLELLKNRLIYLSLKFREEPYEQSRLREAINDCWRAVYHNLGRNKEHPLDDDRFLSTHYVVYFGPLMSHPDEAVRAYFARNSRLQSPSAAKLLESVFISKNISEDIAEEKRITKTTVYEYVQSLQEAVKTWYAIFNPFQSEYSESVSIWLDKLKRAGAYDYLPLILVFLQQEKSDAKRIQLLKGIERLIFLQMLSSGRYYLASSFRETKHAPARLAIELKSGQISSEKAINVITHQADAFAGDKDFKRIVINRLKSDGFYEWPGIRYFLFEYNLDLQRKSKTERKKIHWAEYTENKDDFISVEHIYPQNARSDYWTSRFGAFSQQQRKALRDSLGNLLPLSRPKNSSLSNKPFPEKASGESDNFISYCYGCYAENEVARQKEWTSEQILQRGMKLIKYMEKRWNIDFEHDEQRVNLLGLSFMNLIK